MERKNTIQKREKKRKTFFYALKKHVGVIQHPGRWPGLTFYPADLFFCLVCKRERPGGGVGGRGRGRGRRSDGKRQKWD